MVKKRSISNTQSIPNNNLYYIVIVGIVAVVAIIILVMDNTSSYKLDSEESLVGEAYRQWGSKSVLKKEPINDFKKDKIKRSLTNKRWVEKYFCPSGEKRCVKNSGDEFIQECKLGTWQTIKTCEYGCKDDNYCHGQSGWSWKKNSEAYEITGEGELITSGSVMEDEKIYLDLTGGNNQNGLCVSGLGNFLVKVWWENNEQRLIQLWSSWYMANAGELATGDHYIEIVGQDSIIKTDFYNTDCNEWWIKVSRGSGTNPTTINYEVWFYPKE